MKPSHFSIFVGGYTGESFGVRYESGKLLYEHFGYGFKPVETVELEPTDKAWQQFWTTLHDINVWKWKDRYETPGICDGTNWSVEIDVGGKKLRSTGSNAYPDGQEETESSSVFDQFYQAVSILVDKRTFH